MGTLADGAPVVSGGNDGTVRIWDLDTGAPYPKILGLDADVRDLAVADSHIAITTSPSLIVAIPRTEICGDSPL